MSRRSRAVVTAVLTLTAAVLTLGAAVLTLAALALAQPAAADEGWVITRFAADIEIGHDGALHVTEAIDVDFGTLQRHGIIRRIPVRYRWDDTHVRVYRLAVRSVTDVAGRPVTYETAAEGAHVAIKIGDPDAFVSGARGYRIAYDVAGVLNAFAARDELFWNVNGGDTDVPTRSVVATVRVAAGLGRTECFEGPAGARDPCRASAAAARADFATTRVLAPGEQLTIVAALAKGTVTEPAPIIERDTESLLAYFETGPAFVASAVFVFVAGLAVLLWRWYGAGRDLRERETLVAEYEPPDALRPAQLGLLLDESADTKDVTATIVDLAVRGHLTIEEEPSSGLFAKKDWTLRMTEKDSTGLLPYEKTIYDGLFESGREVKLSALRTHFVDSLRQAQSELYTDSADRKWFATRPDRVRLTYAGLGLVTILAGAGAAFVLGRLAGGGLVGLALAAVGLVALPGARVMPAKTAAGAELLRRTHGFRHYMEIAETERARFAERENIFSAYLPYAIVFGCVERWARAFAGIDTAAQTAVWYAGSGPFDAGRLSSTLQGFSSNLGSAIAATPGSSGGSGFSGGAGGGGGGGGTSSW
jgi:uncharacterized membrane protein YgcG